MLGKPRKTTSSVGARWGTFLTLNSSTVRDINMKRTSISKPLSASQEGLWFVT